jgi:hypothetical protein
MRFLHLDRHVTAAVDRVGSIEGFVFAPWRTTSAESASAVDSVDRMHEGVFRGLTQLRVGARVGRRGEIVPAQTSAVGSQHRFVVCVESRCDHGRHVDRRSRTARKTSAADMLAGNVLKPRRKLGFSRSVDARCRPTGRRPRSRQC